MSTPEGVTGLLVDTSVFARLGFDTGVTSEFARVIAEVTMRRLLLCPPVAAEVGFMARNTRQHTEFIRDLGEFAPCPISPTSQDTLDIQHALWSHGLLRAAGAMDTLIVAYAKVNRATVLHYDSDFEHIASALPGFQHRWIVPRGTAG